MTARTAGRAWARDDGIVLRPATAGDLEDAGVQQALRDGIERGYDGVLPSAPSGSEWYEIEAEGGRVGVMAIERDVPHEHAATVHAIAIVPAQRGHAYAQRALFAAERRLTRDDVRAYYSRVPRTNGRGLYFMLRCGYAPVPPAADDGTTWFRRAETPQRSAAKPLPGAARVHDRSGA